MDYIAEQLRALAVPIADLHEDPANARKGHAVDRIAASLKQYGQRKPIVVNRAQGGKVEAGNGTLAAAKSLGWSHIAAVLVDDDPATAAAYGIADNRVGEFSEWDLDVLSDIVPSLDGLFTGFTLPELDELLPSKRTEGDTEPQIDRADELRQKWGVELGQMWRLGEHRIICGDCTDGAVVERVMGGDKAALAPVDPPYNVGFDYDGQTVNDNKDIDDYERFSRAWFDVCQLFSLRQIVTPGCYNLASWLRWFDAYHVAPWTKSNSMTNGKVTRFWCWEPVIFFGGKWARRRTHDLFDFPIGQQKEVANHPCPKPLAMWSDLIENYSDLGQVILELFSGSGTTIIACENLGRKCRAVEISPSYVAVAIERWAQHTGGTPELME